MAKNNNNDIWGHQSNNMNSGMRDTSAWYTSDRANANVFEENAYAPEETLSGYMAKTFLWMCAGLLLTFLVAYGMARAGVAYRILAGGSPAILIVTIAEIALVVTLSARIHKLSVPAATIMFLVYAALTGVMFSIYFIIIEMNVLIYVFIATSVFFGGLAAASLVFNMQLDSLRPFLFGGLIFLIVFGLISMFVNLGAFETIVCYIGIAIFLAYTAYDTAKIKQNYAYYAGQPDMLQKASIFSALQLYLDFINLFLYILRILGRRRN